MKPEGLVSRLARGGDLVVAEGYGCEFERRGYLRAGCFVPEVVLDRPDLVKSMHEEFVHAGSDVVLAFTYYGQREKLRLIGKEHLLWSLNLTALKIARDVADETGTLMAGNICNSTVYQTDSQEKIDQTEAMFKEMHLRCYKRMMLDLIPCSMYALLDLPAVVTVAPQATDKLLDGVPVWEACRKLEEGGAAVVGLNCIRGPNTTTDLMKEVRTACKGPASALPVPYRTSKECPTMMSLKDPDTCTTAFPLNMTGQLCSSTQIEEFARAAKDLGIQYVGVCCGNCPRFTRIVAETYGRRPPASKFSPHMSQHFIYGNQKSFSNYYLRDLKASLGDTSD